MIWLDIQDKEDDDYKDWLKGEKNKIGDATLKSECGALRKHWSDPALDDNEKFLRDFILNKGWADKEDKELLVTFLFLLLFKLVLWIISACFNDIILRA